MLKVKINHNWEISKNQKKYFDTSTLLSILINIKETGSISKAAKSVGLSYRYAWGILRNAENIFKFKLIESGRGKGTKLSLLANKLVLADKRVSARLLPTLESLSSELEIELEKVINAPTSPIRIDASYGFAVDKFIKKAVDSEIIIDLSYKNSSEAVTALSKGESDLAGFHVPIGDFEELSIKHYKKWLNSKKHKLIHVAIRSQGLFVTKGNPFNIKNLKDLSRPEIRFVNRQNGSGTRMLIEFLIKEIGLKASKINGFENTEFTHSAVAAYIASKMADVGFGIQTAADLFDLDFIPILNERYFFAVNIDMLMKKEIVNIINVLKKIEYKNVVNSLAGYDSTDSGKILSLDEAFGNI